MIDWLVDFATPTHSAFIESVSVTVLLVMTVFLCLDPQKHELTILFNPISMWLSEIIKDICVTPLTQEWPSIKEKGIHVFDNS